MTLTRAEALRLARATTLAHLWHYRAIYREAAQLGEYGPDPDEQLNEVERTCADVMARLDEMIREEEERVRTLWRQRFRCSSSRASEKSA